MISPQPVVVQVDTNSSYVLEMPALSPDGNVLKLLCYAVCSSSPLSATSVDPSALQRNEINEHDDGSHTTFEDYNPVYSNASESGGQM